MTQRSKVKDLVVLVPGMMGSRLARGPEILWGDESPTFLEWAKRHAGSLREMTIGGDDPGKDSLGDGIRATGLIEESPHVVGRFLRPGGYGPLLSVLERRLGLRPPNLRTFPYDWRRDLRVASRSLGQCVTDWLAEWQKQSGNPQARVVLIAHGAGGLVARHYIEAEKGWRQVSRVVTLGAPYGGTVCSLDLLYFGADFERYGISIPDVTPIVRTFTSVYQLLPQFPSIETSDGELLRPFEIRIPSFEQEKMERSRQLYRNLLDQHSQNRARADYGAPETLAIIGIGQPTAERVRLLSSGMLSRDPDPYEIPTDGDGVVTRLSAEAADLAFPARFLYVPQRHGALLEDGAVHTLLCDLLLTPRGNEAPVTIPLPRSTRFRREDGREQVDTDGLAVIPDRPFYRAGETVEIRLLARSATGRPHTLTSGRPKVRVVPAAGGRATALRLVPEKGRPGWMIGRFRTTEPGCFRVVASSPVRELAPFQVVEFFEVEPARASKKPKKPAASRRKHAAPSADVSSTSPKSRTRGEAARLNRAAAAKPGSNKKK